MSFKEELQNRLTDRTGKVDIHKVLKVLDNLYLPKDEEDYLYDWYNKLVEDATERSIHEERKINKTALVELSANQVQDLVESVLCHYVSGDDSYILNISNVECYNSDAQEVRDEVLTILEGKGVQFKLVDRNSKNTFKIADVFCEIYFKD